MKEDSESHPIYVAVDSTMIARCMRCGISESDEWIQTKSGLFCSRDCILAETGNRFFFYYFLVIMMVPFIIAGGRPWYPSKIYIGIFFYLVFSSPLLYCGFLGKRNRKMIPRDSRRDEVSSGVALLKALPSTVSCPKCDGNIDLTKVSEDMVYVCEYCGTSGIIEILNTDDR